MQVTDAHARAVTAQIGLTDAERRSDRRDHVVVGTDRRQGDIEDRGAGLDEPMTDAVGHAGLAHATRTLDGHHPTGLDGRHNRIDVGVPTDQRGGVGEQSDAPTATNGPGHLCRLRDRSVGAAEQLGVQRTDLGARVHPEFGREPPTESGVDRDGVGDPPRSGQCLHQIQMRGLVERVGEAPFFGDRACRDMVAGCHGRSVAGTVEAIGDLPGAGGQLVDQPARFVGTEIIAGGPAPPDRRALRVVGGGDHLGDDVEIGAAADEPVSTARPLQVGGAEQLPQPGDLGVQRRARRPGRVVAPHVVDESLGRSGPSIGQGQRRQQALGTKTGHRSGLRCVGVRIRVRRSDHRHRTEQSDDHLPVMSHPASVVDSADGQTDRGGARGGDALISTHGAHL
ncbi:hypothetical protein GOPIP_085_00930 [Gordonia polyisoprenivorans NBRC 16320 = JCM 10675]|nr:hypothetical protein GOPIP_085_00930 [Gordonia polyisoprenivorans NBRC 16320 = JCM 10675]